MPKIKNFPGLRPVPHWEAPNAPQTPSCTFVAEVLTDMQNILDPPLIGAQKNSFFTCFVIVRLIKKDFPKPPRYKIPLVTEYPNPLLGTFLLARSLRISQFSLKVQSISK